jgi:hypothetical protein
VAFHGNTEGDEPLGRQPIRRIEHRPARSSRLGGGTLACPLCDAPIVLGMSPAAPSDPMSCPYCRHAGAVRDFLSLESPSRPAHVEVRVVLRTSAPRLTKQQR